MTRMTFKLTLASLVLVGAIGYLAFAGMQEGWVQYHVQVDEFANEAKFRTQRVRLAGAVADEGVQIGAGKLVAKFDLKGASASIPVSYKGVLPDLFKPGCDVVVEGKLDSAGVFQADLLMTKCASKYESKNPHGADAENRKPKSEIRKSSEARMSNVAPVAAS